MNKVKELCVRRDIKQKELAAVIGVSQPTVSDWFNNKTDPSGERLEKLSKYFNVSVAVILGYDKDPLAPVSAVDDFYPRPQESTSSLALDGDPVMGWADDRPETQAIAKELYSMALNIGATKEDVDAFRNYMLLTKEQQHYIDNSMKFLRSQRKEEEGT